jgi:hypothetical protein
MSQQNDVIEAYVADVIRRVPRKERNEIGLELRGLLTEMLADRALTDGKPADDAMVLAMLREFGTPADIAARYRPPGVIIIPTEQTRSFALLSLIGVGLQWALTLPRVFEGQHLSTWWFTWGLGSLWWPGFMAMIALVATGIRQTGLFKPIWRPRIVDPDRVNRGALAFGLIWFAIGVALMISLPWIVDLLPGALPQVLAFDTDFLQQRAWPVVVLWLADFLILMAVLSSGRWTQRLRRLDITTSLAWVALLAWWLAAGNMFLAKATNDGAKAGIALVILIVVVDLAYRLYRRRTRIHLPKLGG